MSGLEEMSREELIELVRVQAARQEALIARLAAMVDALEEENAELRERVARLERALSRNSGNSGMPPSSDDQPGKAQPKDKPATASKAGRDSAKRKPGKQKGAPGTHLAWSDDPDEIADTFDHFPEGMCGCGADLADATDLGVTGRHQQIEIPLVSAQRFQHDLHTVACRCGAVHSAPRPEGVPEAAVSFGVKLQTLCVYLMVAHAIPVQRCAELVESLTGAKPSQGFVHGLLKRAAAAVAAANRRIWMLLTLAYAVCCDETPIRVGPKKVKKYLMVACDRLYTWYLLGDRSLDTFEQVIPHLGGVIVHDRYQNYDSARLGSHTHQLCAAHLLRDLEDCVETYPGRHWPEQIQRALRGLIHEANLARKAGAAQIDPRVKADLIRGFRHGVLVGLSEVHRLPGGKQVKQPIGRLLLEVLRGRENDVLRFAHDLNVPPTSNQAERDVRPAKTQQKISGRLRSERATEHRYAIRGYLSTAVKHGSNAVAVIHDALLGRPWMPPGPATP
ncbi:IS66 family transposase [Microbispora sp. NBC_01389]|uniref:IS66 family transposase n=1 Tax=Microbispora sp. NBC_01389 TaxID=2903584 RepID=UPI003250FE32